METNQTPQTEKVFFQDKMVKVTQSSFSANGKTYAMRNISSVSIHVTPKNLSGGIMLIVIGMITAYFGGIALFIGLAIIGLGIFALIMAKDDFAVRINSNSGESDALTSTNKSYVQEIVTALRDAIVYRG